MSCGLLLTGRKRKVQSSEQARLKMTDIKPFFIEKGTISPGGKAAIGIKINGVVERYCIGSGDDFRDAKASALKNLRCLMLKVKAMKD